MKTAITKIALGMLLVTALTSARATSVDTATKLQTTTVDERSLPSTGQGIIDGATTPGKSQITIASSEVRVSTDGARSDEFSKPSLKSSSDSDKNNIKGVVKVPEINSTISLVGMSLLVLTALMKKV